MFYFFHFDLVIALILLDVYQAIPTDYVSGLQNNVVVFIQLFINSIAAVSVYRNVIIDN